MGPGLLLWLTYYWVKPFTRAGLHFLSLRQEMFWPDLLLGSGLLPWLTHYWVKPSAGAGSHFLSLRQEGLAL